MLTITTRTLCIGLLWAAALPAVAEEPAVTYESLLREMVDRTVIARWPAPAYTCAQASSYDRAAKSPTEDWFANADRGQFLREEEHDGRTEWVMMDAAGPGAVVRFWSANPWDAGTVRVYLDEATEPAIETRLDDLLGGTWRVGAPLSAVRGRGWNLYLPIPYAKHCKITADQRDFYYQINYRTYTDPVDVETFSMEVFERGREVLRTTTAALRDVGRAFHQPRLIEIEQTVLLHPGESLTLDLPPGPQAVRELQIHIGGGDDVTRQVVLQGTFDGSETIWCPVGQFFGSGLGVNPYRSWWTTVSEGGVMRSWWPMPYEKSARLVVTNTGDELATVRVLAKVGHWSWDDRSMHFYATWRAEDPIDSGVKQDWNYVKIDGKGVYAGDALALTNPTTIWWGEGDEKIFVDGEAFPSHFGTGTEDYYGYAWGDWNFFDGPFHAQPRVDGPVVLGNTSLLRTRSLDAIPFTKSLNFDMEIWHWRAVEVAYSVATFFYAEPGATHNRVADRTEESLRVPTVAPPMKIQCALEAEEMEVTALPAGATCRVEGNWWNCEWSNDAQMWYGLTQVNDAVEVRSHRRCEGPHQVVLRASRYPDYATIAVSVNGKRLGEPIDLWQKEGLHETGPIELGVVDFDGGYPVFRFEVVGHNPEAQNTGTYFGVDCIELRPQ